MRIPSQFDEQSLYRRKIPRNESVRTYRKLIRLALGLALVVVVMLEAAKPAVYRPFFGSSPSDNGGAAANLPSAVDRRARNLDGKQPESSRIAYSPKDRQTANAIVAQLPRDQQVRWTVALSRSLRGEKTASATDTTATTVQELKFAADMPIESLSIWKQIVGELSRDLDTSATDSKVGLAQKYALLDALDDAASNRVIDGSVWRSEDFDFFYRTLDAARELPQAGFATVGALPLLQQPDVYLNQTVTIHGSLALAENIKAPQNPYGIGNYWQLWIKPAEGADRPIVACVPDVPRIVADQAGNAETSIADGPPLTVVGTFLKRLAYRSGAGADLAPVVVGRITYAPFAEGEKTTESTNETTPVPQGKFWLFVSSSCIAGIGLAVLLMWRTSVSARESRSLRVAYREAPDDFLKGLSTLPAKEPPESEQKHP